MRPEADDTVRRFEGPLKDQKPTWRRFGVPSLACVTAFFLLGRAVATGSPEAALAGLGFAAIGGFALWKATRRRDG